MQTVTPMNLQNAEFDAADEFAKALKLHNSCAVVDDDYPQIRHRYECALAGLVTAMKANGRFSPSNRYGVVDPGPLNTFMVDVLAEVDKATTKFPTWPTDPMHAMGVVNEEVGELAKAVLQELYEPEKNPPDAVHKEAVQAAAMLFRFAASFYRYSWSQGEQHVQ